MKRLHIANVNFEWELETRSNLSLKEAFSVHPNFLQLQFLPFLYAPEGDGVVVTHPPPAGYLDDKPARLHLFDETITGYDKIETWGWSDAIKRWTTLPYVIPSRLRELASKAFAFTHSPQLPGAKLLHQMSEVEAWLKVGPYPKVIKSCYALAGRGRSILESEASLEKVKSRVAERFKRGELLIGEPWVKREMDFSTQWMIDGESTFLGATVMENSERGVYKKTIVDREIPFLEEHLERVKGTLKQISAAGYVGNLGIDALVYENKLHPIVEINLRKTFGWLALKLQRSISYEKADVGLLPSFLEKITFPKQLNLL
ncbi:MAG: [Butirosin acyl-carrier protein]--L-glutamate ligase [Chlamydiae bacterium]|nr:[Butirosin acyl-carrier protein]--L-glutamate ligase [Chlamydiota bacterium]